MAIYLATLNVNFGAVMRARVLWMILGGLLIALGLFFAVQFIGASESDPETPAVNEASAKLRTEGIAPITFTNISEYVDDTGRKFRLEGKAEAGGVITLQNRGERLRQLKATEDGEWGVTLDIDGSAMVLEAVLFTPDGGVTIRAEETIFRIPVPESPTVAAAEYIAPAMIMVSAPGSPTRIIQSPFGGSPTEGGLSLSAVDYDGSGGMIISGTSSEAGRVRISSGEIVIGETRIAADGRWTFIAGNTLPLGEYVLQVEVIRSAEDRVTLSVPFERLPPLAQGQGNEGALSVKFEPYRWQVRRTLIGGGTQSTVIFAPNIRLPEIPE